MILRVSNSAKLLQLGCILAAQTCVRSSVRSRGPTKKAIGFKAEISNCCLYFNTSKKTTYKYNHEYVKSGSQEVGVLSELWTFVNSSDKRAAHNPRSRG